MNLKPRAERRRMKRAALKPAVVYAEQPVMNRKARNAFNTLHRRKKLRLMRPLMSTSDFAFVAVTFPERM